MDRKGFLKTLSLGTVGALIFGKQAVSNAASEVVVTDNLVNGVHVGDNPPDSTHFLWVDTSRGGITKYYDGSAWVPTKAVWG